MTTTIKITSHNYPARVEILDGERLVETRILSPEDGEQEFYCTTTRELRVIDLDYDDPAVIAATAASAL